MPVLPTSLPDVVGVFLGLLVLVAGLAAFFLSRSEPTLEALERQHTLLGAAAALEQRARAIHEWPIDEARSPAW